MSNNPIKYKDLIEPDNSIVDAIAELQKLNKELSALSVQTVKDAKALKKALESTSPDTPQGQEATRKAIADTEKLERVKRQVERASSEVVRQITEEKMKLQELNKETKLAIKLNDSALGSFDSISAQYSINTKRLKAMSKEQRENTEEGRDLVKVNKELYEEMKRQQSARGGDSLNVGNYPQMESYADQIKDLLGLNSEFGRSLMALGESGGGIKGMFAQLGTSVKAFGTTLWTLMANPVFLTIAGLAAVGSALKFWFDYNKGLLESTRLTKQFTDLSGVELMKLRSEIQATADMFNKDYKDVLIATNAVAKEMGITHSEALKSINDGFLAGADSAGDFTRQLKEYSTFARRAGLDTDELIGLIVRFNRAGVFDDKGIDAIKEATLSIGEMTPIAEEALKGIGLSGKEIQSQLKSGAKTSFEIIQEIAKKTQGFSENSSEYGTVIADVFKGAGEDAGKTLIEILATGEGVKVALTDIEKLRKELLESQRELNETQAKFFESEELERFTIRASELWNDVTIAAIKSFTDSKLGIMLGFYGMFDDMESEIKSRVSQFDIDITGVFINEEDVKSAEQKIEYLSLLMRNMADGSFLKNSYLREIDELNRAIKATNANANNKENSDTQVIPLTPEEIAKLRKTNLDLSRKYEDALLAQEADGFDKRRKQSDLNYNRQIEDLQNQLQTDEELTKEGKEHINGIIKSIDQQRINAALKIEHERTEAIKQSVADNLKILTDSADADLKEWDTQIKRDNDKFKKEQEKNKSLLAEFATYEQKRIDIIAKYAEKRKQMYEDDGVTLKSGYTLGNVDNLNESQEKDISSVNNEELESAKKSSAIIAQMFEDTSKKSIADINKIRNEANELISYLANTESKDIVAGFGMSAEQLKTLQAPSKERDSLKNRVDALHATGVKQNPFGQLASEIENLFKAGTKGDGEINLEKKLALLGTSASKSAKMIGGLASGLSDMFSAMGNDKMAGVADGVEMAMTSISSVANGFASGGIVGGIAAVAGELINFTTMAFEAEARHQTALEAIQNVKVEGQKEYNALLREQNLLYEQGNTIFGDDPYGKAHNAISVSKGVNTDLKKQTQEIGNIEVVTGHKKTGLFGWGKGEDTYSNILDVYPDLIDSEGRLNEERAKSILATEKLSDENRKAIEEGVELTESYQESVSMMNDYLGSIFGDLGNAMSDALVDAFRNGTDAGEEFSKSMVSMLEKLAQDFAYSMAIAPILEEAQKEIERINKDENLSEEDRVLAVQNVAINTGKELAASEDDFFNYLELIQQGAAQEGVEIFKPDEDTSKNEEDRTASAKTGIATASQESVNETNGLLNSVQGLLSETADDTSIIAIEIQKIRAFMSSDTGVGNTQSQYMGDTKDFLYVENKASIDLLNLYQKYMPDIVVSLLGISENTAYCKHLETIDVSIGLIQQSLDDILTKGVKSN